MTKYELKKATREFKGYRNRHKIEEGCTINAEYGDIFDEIVEVFDSKDEALNALRAYKSEIDIYGDLYHITEYFVEETEYDDDGKPVVSEGIWAFAPLPKLNED